VDRAYRCLSRDERSDVSGNKPASDSAVPGFDQAGRRLLTKEEEIDLSNRFIKNGDTDARNELVIANSGLAHQFARREARRYDFVDLDDLTQEAFIGLMRACDKFDPSLGYRFTTYCCYWIRAKISRRIMVLTKEHNLPVPGAGMEDSDNGRRVRPRYRSASMGDTVFKGHNTSHDGPLTWEEMISGGFEDQEDVVINSQRSQKVRTAVDEIFSETDDPRLCVVITERLMNSDPATLDEIGYMCGVSREGARLLEKRVIAMLKKKLNN